MTATNPSRRAVGLSAAMALAVSLLATPALAHDPIIGVEPDAVDVILAPGTSTDVTKTVHTAEIPPTPDIFLLFDTTSSMGDDIDTVKAEVGILISTILGTPGVTDPAFGVGSYADFPFSPWGASSDDPYELVLPITTDMTAVTTAVAGLTLSPGGDPEESGYEGLYQALTGAGRNLNAPDGSPPDADFADPGEIAPDLDAGFRTDSSQVIILLGDAPFHDPGDAPTSTQFPAGYPGAGAADVSAALGGVSLFCMLPSALVLGGPGAQCAGLGGSVLNVGDASEDIVDAILLALGEVEVEVTPQATCDDLNVSIAWDSAGQTVVSGEDATFLETISAGPGAPQGETVNCTVEFLVAGELLEGFTQSVTVTIPDVTAPTVACDPGTNPHGKTVPGGTDEDGFFLLTAEDNVDPNPQIFVIDSGSGQVFGPYPSGTTIKYVQAPGASPNEKMMGSTKGLAGAVAVKITGTGDALVVAVDASGNVSAPVECLVPPPPK